VKRIIISISGDAGCNDMPSPQHMAVLQAVRLLRGAQGLSQHMYANPDTVRPVLV
jgi:hypothetical protein